MVAVFTPKTAELNVAPVPSPVELACVNVALLTVKTPALTMLKVATPMVIAN
jgi:hypothetical protein